MVTPRLPDDGSPRLGELLRTLQARAPSPHGTLRRLASAFLTGLLFLAPVLLVIVLAQVLLGYILAAVGPDSFTGRVLAGGGRLVAGDIGATLAFWIGVLLLLGLIAGIGFYVQTRARDGVEKWLDGLLGRIPVLGGIYRPIAQMVRMVGKSPGGELKGMSAVVVRWGDTEVLSLLASPKLFDLGEGPRRLVLIPTAPVPIGGALLFVDADKVRPVPGLGADDLAKIYISMGTIAPASIVVEGDAGLRVG